ncbi:MAG: hypothetical protein LBI35_00045 [Burkholderiales bacterium]|jgi:hypothetical protein|nr:hypothetical protein [Burkholderiales bacterium]
MRQELSLYLTRRREEKAVVITSEAKHRKDVERRFMVLALATKDFVCNEYIRKKFDRIASLRSQ